MSMRILVLCIVAIAAFAAERQPAKPAQKQPARPAQKRVQKPCASLANGTEVEPGIWQVKQPDGSVATCRKTPWGVMELKPGRDTAGTSPRGADRVPAAVKAEQPNPGIKAVKDGDLIRFEKTTPFSTYKWSKKESELTEFEKEIWEREKPKTEEPAHPEAAR